MNYKNKFSHIFIDRWVQFITHNKETDPSQTYKPSLLLTGPCGIGKTKCLYEILHSYDYTITEFNLLDYKDHANIKQQLNNILRYSNIKSLFTGTSTRKVLIFNEMDRITTSERTIITILVQYIRKNMSKKNFIPIVFKANHYKTYFKNIADVSMYLKFPLPTDNDILLFCKQYVHTHNINLTDIQLNCLLEYFTPNFRLIQNHLDIIGIYLKKNKKFSLKKIICLLKKNEIDIDIDIYQGTYNICNESLDPDTCSYIMSKDTKYNLFLLHKNIIHYIQYNTKNTFHNKITNVLYLYELINFSSTLLCFSDISIRDPLYAYINNTVGVACNSFINDPKTKLEYGKYSDINKSSIYSKLNYKYCNLKYSRIITNRFNINEYNFQLFSHYLFYFIHKYKTRKYVKRVIDYINKWSILPKELDKIFKLNYINKHTTKKVNYNKIYKYLEKQL